MTVAKRQLLLGLSALQLIAAFSSATFHLRSPSGIAIARNGGGGGSSADFPVHVVVRRRGRDGGSSVPPLTDSLLGRSSPNVRTSTSRSSAVSDDVDPTIDAFVSQRGGGGGVGVASPYRLLWSRGSIATVALATAAWLAAYRFVPAVRAASDRWNYLRATTSAAADCHAQTVGRSLVGGVGLPLLSSACCAVQLLLNALSVGCAGLNTHLGPLRPLFVSLLLLFTVTSGGNGSGRATIASWTIALLPELVHGRNLARRAVARAKLPAAAVARTTVVRVVVPSMGCVACVDKIDSDVASALSRAGRVDARVASTLLPPRDDGTKRGGVATATFGTTATSTTTTDDDVAEVVRAVRAAGFDECRVLSTTTTTTTE